VEKRRPHYSLATIQATFVSVSTLRITRTATRCAEDLSFSLADVVALIQGMERSQFYKSMTSDLSPRIWQDVYYVPYDRIVLYVKFTVDAQGNLLISFKEK
jgi:motility quorum-sensing regulator/GCU-specific mRNA interferase toxin